MYRQINQQKNVKGVKNIHWREILISGKSSLTATRRIRFKLLGFVQDNRRGGESSMAKDVLCEVSSCKYWGAGNKCNASAIYVVNRMGKQASSSEETDCKTFEPKL
jgi:predicted site-specific integrase-resolvase